MNFTPAGTFKEKQKTFITSAPSKPLFVPKYSEPNILHFPLLIDIIEVEM